MTESKSASKLQARIRGHNERMHPTPPPPKGQIKCRIVFSEDDAAMKLQSRVRGHQERAHPSEPHHVTESKSAAKLQARIRGHNERVHPTPPPVKTTIEDDLISLPMDDESVGLSHPQSPKAAGDASASEASALVGDDISLPLESEPEPDRDVGDLAVFEASKRQVTATKRFQNGQRSLVGVRVGDDRARVEALVVATDATYTADFEADDLSYTGLDAASDRDALARRVFDDVDLVGPPFVLALAAAPAPAPAADADPGAAAAMLQARIRGSQERTNPKPRPAKTSGPEPERPTTPQAPVPPPKDADDEPQRPATPQAPAPPPTGEGAAPPAPAPAPASPAKVAKTMRASIRLPEDRGGGKMLVKLVKSADGIRIHFLDSNMDSHHSQTIDEADLPADMTDVMTRKHAEYLAERFYPKTAQPALFSLLLAGETTYASSTRPSESSTGCLQALRPCPDSR